MSNDTEVLAAIRAIPIFAACSDDELEQIDQLTTEVQVEAGRELVTQGTTGNEFLVIISGTATVERDGLQLAELGPGDYFGELALLESIPRTATVTATSEMLIHVIDRRGFSTLLTDQPSLQLAMLKSLARRLAELDEEIVSLKQ